MSKFEALFGVRPEAVGNTCVLMPFVFKDALKRFGARGFAQGKLYACADNGSFSVIRTGMGAGLTGDAVLYLKDTPCREVVLFGSCGLFGERDGLSIGSLVAPAGCYSAGSFTEMLSGRAVLPGFFTPDKEMLESFLGMPGRVPVAAVDCLTVPSLKLEESMAEEIAVKGIAAADMECSAFYGAAAFCGLKAMALFYVTDIINKKPFYAAPGADDEAKINASREQAVDMICDFIKGKARV